MRIGVLASHRGTILQALIDSGESGDQDIQIVVVISNNGRSGAIERARNHGIPHFHLSGKNQGSPEALDTAIRDTLRKHGVELVVLAGYLKMLGPRTIAAFPNRILNTHPALLPKYGGRGMYGMRVHEAVLAAGESVTGITVHVVDDDYDTGPAVAQLEVPVEPGDTPESLAERSAVAERPFVVETVGRIASGDLRLPAG
ncbi:MAG TPA: phosphoribosylglycinamide formyltransferase [bacterium]|nr:phosphoribosylglycinamide formyltransferase [bacterium]